MSRAFTKERDDAPEPPLTLAKREEPHYERPADLTQVGFGATVRVVSGKAFDRTFTLVKDAEADIKAGKIGMSSPLAQALLGARKDDRVCWERPIGDIELLVCDVRYANKP